MAEPEDEDDGLGGVREPRRPKPLDHAGGASAEPEIEVDVEAVASSTERATSYRS